MANKAKNTFGNIVYSTNKELNLKVASAEPETLLPGNQKLHVQISKKGRAGKTATVVMGFVGSSADLETLGKLLRHKCGVGGSVKDGEIVLQGDMRDKAVAVLLAEGYKARRI